MTNQELINRIDKEAENGSEFEKLIAQHIIDHFPGVSKMDDIENKTLKGCVKAIYERAKKDFLKKSAQRSGVGTSAIRNDEVYAWAEEYFGIEHSENQPAEKSAHAEEKSSLDVDLFDLI